MLIADHARKDCPPRSVSWKYINDCVAAGELVNIEDYRIQQPQPPTRGNGTRVPFTKLDEQILVTWVRNAGAKTSGNEIYKDLAKMVGTAPKVITSQQQRPMLINTFQYPHHSWHSWRDKWVNKMSLLSEDQLPPVLPELPPPRTQPGHDPQTTPGTSAPPAKPTPAGRVAKASSELRQKPLAGSRNVFTDEEDKILAQYVAECIRKGLKVGGNKIYQAFEEEVSHGSCIIARMGS